MGRVPSVGEVLPSQLTSGAWLDNARNPFARDTLFEFPLYPLSAPAFDTVEKLVKSSASPVTTQCTDNLNAWDGTAAAASSLTYTATMHFYLTDTSATTCLSEGACTADEECPVGYRCSLASRTARMLLFGILPAEGQCVHKLVI